MAVLSLTVWKLGLRRELGSGGSMQIGEALDGLVRQFERDLLGEARQVMRASKGLQQDSVDWSTSLRDQ